MGIGIIVCGLNGSGKSTLGKVLAEKLAFHFIDVEDLYFPKTSLNYVYSASRSHAEVERLLTLEIKKHANFVFSSVKGDYGANTFPYYQYAVLIDAPKNIRLARIRVRSYQKFGERILPGGDLYEQEESFFNMVNSRPEQYAEEWICSLKCPIIRVDGTKSVKDNVDYIYRQIQNGELNR